MPDYAFPPVLLDASDVVPKAPTSPEVSVDNERNTFDVFDEFQSEDCSVGLVVKAGENNSKSNEPTKYDHATVDENIFDLFPSFLASAFTLAFMFRKSLVLYIENTYFLGIKFCIFLQLY